MAPPALLDGRHPPWCSYGCLVCCCGFHGPLELNNWAVGHTVERRFTVPCHLPHPHHRPHPRLPHPCPAPRHGASTRGRVAGNWTGCCQRKDPFTDVLSTQSSERGFSRGFQQDTRFTGETKTYVCGFMCQKNGKQKEIAVKTWKVLFCLFHFDLWNYIVKTKCGLHNLSQNAIFELRLLNKRCILRLFRIKRFEMWNYPELVRKSKKSKSESKHTFKHGLFGV